MATAMQQGFIFSLVVIGIAAASHFSYAAFEATAVPVTKPVEAGKSDFMPNAARLTAAPDGVYIRPITVKCPNGVTVRRAVTTFDCK